MRELSGAFEVLVTLRPFRIGPNATMRLMSPLSERFDGISGNGNDFIGWNHLRLEISGREMRYSWYGNCQCSCRLWRLLSRRGGRTAGWAAWAAAGHRRSPPLPVRPRPSPMEAAGGRRWLPVVVGGFGALWAGVDGGGAARAFVHRLMVPRANFSCTFSISSNFASIFSFFFSRSFFFLYFGLL